jgi:hypothetical protein
VILDGLAARLPDRADALKAASRKSHLKHRRSVKRTNAESVMVPGSRSPSEPPYGRRMKAAERQRRIARCLDRLPFIRCRLTHASGNGLHLDCLEDLPKREASLGV